MKNFIKTNKRRIALAIAITALCVFMCSCASWERAFKDVESDFGGGLPRTVSVYDLNGNLVKAYTGKFDIETDNETYILWDDEMGKRHIIYFSTFNVIIDEN